MHHAEISLRLRPHRTIALVTALAATGVIVALSALPAGAAMSRGMRKQVVVRTARNAVLNATILVDRRGRTLYHLSVEKHGRFICKNGACLAVWKPLVVHAGTRPAGTRFLGTVRRPDGRRQVTYKGAPLYTFVQDTKRGDVKGNGFRDVGVWHPIVVSGHAQSSTSRPGAYPGGFGY